MVSNTRNAPIWGLTLLFLANHCSTLAQSSLPEVKIIGHYDNSIGTSDAASQGIVKGSTLDDQAILRPGEALETVPGLVVTQHSGDGKANQYFLRGYNLDHGTDFSTNINGVPANMPTNAHGQGYSDVNYLIPELIDQIHYRKGPYFPSDGDFSSAGSADIRYKNQLDQSIYQLTFGSFGFRRNLLAGSIQLNQDPKKSKEGLIPDGPVLTTALELLENNGPWTTPEGLKKINAFSRLSNGTRLNGWSMDANYYTAGWNSTDQVPLELINSGQLGRFDSMNPTDGGDTGRAIVSGEFHDLDSSGYTKISAFAEHYKLNLWSDFTFYELRPATGDQFNQFESRNILGSKVAKGFYHSLFGLDSLTEIGAQLRQDYIHVGLLNSQARIPFATVSNDMVSQMQTGLYAQTTTAWTDCSRTIVGLRQDYINMDLTALANPLNSGNARDQKTSPKFSWILGPWEKTELFYNYGKGFHSNDARGVIDKWDPTQPGVASSPVPALVGSIGKEVGLRTQYFEGLQSSLAIWKLNSNSEIIYSADSSIGSTTPNGASQRSGIEWNNHYIANNWLFFDADIAWTHAEYSIMNDNGSTGNSIPNAVGKVAIFRGAVHDLGSWAAGVETRYIGAYPLNQDSSLIGPSAIVTNLRLQNKLSNTTTIYIDGLNIFNRQYYDVAYAQDYQVTPASPFVPEGITVHPGDQGKSDYRFEFFSKKAKI